MRVTLDYPPVWLAGFAAAGWAAGRIAPHGPARLAPAGWAALALGLALMAWAAAVMLGARTTLDPHGAPSALVTAGPFRLSRNPIYLADALILSGICLIAQAPIAALLLVPAFAATIAARFIRPEEVRLAAAFPADFARWSATTRRWL